MMSEELDEIWSLYADDGAQALDAMETALLSMQEDPPEAQANHVSALFRAVHTFKGNSRVLGLAVVESRAHLAEDLIGLVRDDGVPFDDTIHALLVETCDVLRHMLEHSASLRQDADEASSTDLMQRLNARIAEARASLRGFEPVPDEAPVDEAQADEAPVAEPEAVPVPGPVVAPEADLAVQAEPEPPAASERPTATSAAVAVDPAYIAIFSEMATDALTRIGNAATPEAARRAVADLLHAARQLGLSAWCAALDVPDDPDVIGDRIRAMLPQLQGSAPQHAIPEQPAADDEAGTAISQIQTFFERLQEPLSVIARHGIERAVGGNPDIAELRKAAAAVADASRERGYVRIAQTCEDIVASNGATALRRAELELYEELAVVEALESGGDGETLTGPARLLAGWSAEHIFDTLDELGTTLDRIRSAPHSAETSRSLSRLTRLVRHACRNYGLDTAAQLAMSLLDLFDRGHAAGNPADAILLRIAQSFVTTLELVFDALRVGEAPDTARLEQLFTEASELSFTGRGLLTATAVERRLGLPPEFHRVLSPESVRAASEAVAEGQGFWILRADVNDDDRLAEALFGFIGSGKIKAITNVTVFRGAETLFDFLIASRLNEPDLAEALALMDPSGRRLTLIRRLEVEDDTPSTDTTSAAADATVQAGNAGLEMPMDMLERIGELAAGQAMVHGMITDLSESDPLDRLDEILKRHASSPAVAAAEIRSFGEELSRRLRDIVLHETQLFAQVTELQQSTVELRSRPIDSVLRPLAALAATEGRKRGLECRLTHAGGELLVDLVLIEPVKRVMRSLILSRIEDEAEASPRRLHVAVHRAEDRLVFVLDDATGTPAIPDGARTEAARCGGSLRAIALPGGGTRFHLEMPVNLTVLEGMVVGCAGSRYVLPVESIRTILQPGPDSVIRVSAGGGGRYLRLNHDEIIALRPLMRNVGVPASDSGSPRVVVVVAHGQGSVAVPVDEVIGQQLVLLRPLRGLMSRLDGLTGVALLSGGEVGMVLSASALCAGGAAADERMVPAHV